MEQRIRKLGFAIILVIACATAFKAHAFADAQITSVTSTTFDGPAHHGLMITAAGNSDPNLTFYEVNVREDDGNPFYATWDVYANELMPFDDGIRIDIPYRNGIVALKSDTTYCVRIRAVYTSTATNWSEECGVTLTVSNASSDDVDGDGLTETEEYAQGTDPNNSDSDGDSLSDGTEIGQGNDPNESLTPNIIVRTTSIDFGDGDPEGHHSNQHQYIEIDNEGDSVALIDSITIEAASGGGRFPFMNLSSRGATNSFHVGAYPATLTNIPPNNVVRIPVDFIPSRRGTITGQVLITSSNNPNPIDPITVAGSGISQPDCKISPSEIDFGTVAVNDQAVDVQYFTISNTSSRFTLFGAPNTDESPFGFTVSSDVSEMAPGLRGFVLPAGKELDVPVYFRHSVAGTYEGTLTINSLSCGEQTVTLKGVAE